MLKHLTDRREAREAMLALLSTSGTLAGIGVGLVGVINSGHVDKQGIADDLLLFGALGFLVVCYLIFFALREQDSARASRYRQAIDLVFLGAMTLMVFAGFVVMYEFL